MKVAKELKALKKVSKSKKQQASAESVVDKDLNFIAKQIHELLIKLEGDEYSEYLALQILSGEICRTHGFAKWKNYISEQLEKNKGGIL